MANRRKKRDQLKKKLASVAIIADTEHNGPNWSSKFMHSPPLPEICLMILKYLSLEDLLVISQINKSWKQWCAESTDWNRIWWKFCMKFWYQDDQIQEISAKELKKRNWKESFLRLTPKVPIRMGKRPRERIRVEKWDQPVENDPNAMREYYKSIRSKPKGKIALKDPLEKTNWFNLQDECF